MSAYTHRLRVMCTRKYFATFFFIISETQKLGLSSSRVYRPAHGTQTHSQPTTQNQICETREREKWKKIINKYRVLTILQFIAKEFCICLSCLFRFVFALSFSQTKNRQAIQTGTAKCNLSCLYTSVDIFLADEYWIGRSKSHTHANSLSSFQAIWQHQYFSVQLWFIMVGTKNTWHRDFFAQSHSANPMYIATGIARAIFQLRRMHSWNFVFFFLFTNLYHKSFVGIYWK